ncbi:MAG TPA: hypothetical protein VHF58_01720 [Solirubrobacterales bacterium]|nr:hypothetical protein [Solirubrobacterales bacterium]
MSETDETAQEEIGETAREADHELSELEQEGKEMEGRLEEAEAESGDVDVPAPADATEPGLDETDIPEGEGESADEAGQ